MTPQELKESILLLAAQGKLVPQIATEGFGRDIIKTIASQRASLEKDGSIKKRKPLPQITENEIPFDIPDSWVWVRVYDLANVCETPFADGPFGSNLKTEHYTCEQEVRIIQLSNIGENGWKSRNTRYTTYEHLKTIQRSEVAPGDIVIAKMMPAGRAIIVPEGENKYVLSSDAVKFVSHPILNKMYLYYVINSQAFRNQVYSEVQGITRVRTSLQKLIQYLLPIPPLAEQKRIVAKIEELLPYIDRYEQAWSKLEDFNKCFPGDMQKSILQVAIKGKLVEQRPEEGTGEELYRKIQAEKQKLIKAGTIKKEKPLPEITEDEKPFDIPESWMWVRLGKAISLLSGTDYTPEEYNDAHKGIPYITGASSLSSDGVLINRWTETPRLIANRGDVLLVCKGSGYGKTVICDIEEAHIARQIMSIKHSENIFMKYIKSYLEANLKAIKSNGQGVIPGIDRGSVLNMAFPLPPLAEQKRIVAKLEEILPLCEKLK